MSEIIDYYEKFERNYDIPTDIIGEFVDFKYDKIQLLKGQDIQIWSSKEKKLLAVKVMFANNETQRQYNNDLFAIFSATKYNKLLKLYLGTINLSPPTYEKVMKIANLCLPVYKKVHNNSIKQTNDAGTMEKVQYNSEIKPNDSTLANLEQEIVF